MAYTVYMHISPSNKRYIGITCRSPQERWGNNGSGYKGQAFENAINKYGWDNIQHAILFENLSKEKAEELEIALIAQYKTTDKKHGYNVQNGGSSVGKYTEETRQKISQSRKGCTPWNKGIPRTDAEKAKMSKSHIGLTKGKNNGRYGKGIPPEQLKKMIDARQGMEPYWKGKHLRESAKQKIGKANSKSIIRVEDGKVFDSVKQASAEVNVTSTAICNCLKGKTKHAGGFRWEYI